LSGNERCDSSQFDAVHNGSATRMHGRERSEERRDLHLPAVDVPDVNDHLEKTLKFSLSTDPKRGLTLSGEAKKPMKSNRLQRASTFSDRLFVFFFTRLAFLISNRDE